jgi:cytidylate kinase
MAHRVVAIDGPAASGKSSVARMLARQLAFAYVNSGAMYRGVTWQMLRQGVDPHDAAAITHAIEQWHIEAHLENGEAHFAIDGIDPTPHLNQAPVNEFVSTISSIPRVRELLVARMRAFADEADLVMEGRDIGSVVFPETPFKFYIDASPDVRARRRAAQGQRDEIAARDRADSSRCASPLVIAEDAHVIDSSNLTIEGVVGEIIGRLKLKGLR